VLQWTAFCFELFTILLDEEKMPVFGKNVTFVTRHIHNLRGGSAPILAQASDGLSYVVKFTNNLQGTNLLFNESAGSELYRACGLPVPSWKPLMLTDEFLEQNQACWMQTSEGRLRPEPGLCFGSRYLGGEETHLLEILPGNYFKRIRNRKSFWLAWLIDICAGHIDNRQALFVEDSTGWLDAFFVDHGHLFGGPEGEQQRHFQASRYLDARIYLRPTEKQLASFQKVVQNLNVDRLLRRINALPEEWKPASALENFAQCLDRLSTPDLLQSILNTIVEAQQHAQEVEERNRQVRRNPPVSILGVPVAGLSHGAVANGYDCAACA
jgi:hypothetical protein